MLTFFKELITNAFTAGFLNLFSLAAILCGIVVIIAKNPIVSVLFLIGLFLGISCYLIMSGLNYIGISYLLVYVGAVSILFLFILMLINVRISELLSDTSNSIPLAIILGIYFIFPVYNILPDNVGFNSYTGNINHYLKELLFNNLLTYFTWVKSFFIWLLNFISFNSKPIFNLYSDKIAYVTSNLWDGNLAETSHITSIGNIMYTSYPIWLILTSIILLLAMVGAIVITIKQDSSMKQSKLNLFPLRFNQKRSLRFNQKRSFHVSLKRWAERNLISKLDELLATHNKHLNIMSYEKQLRELSDLADTRFQDNYSEYSNIQRKQQSIMQDFTQKYEGKSKVKVGAINKEIDQLNKITNDINSTNSADDKFKRLEQGAKSTKSCCKNICSILENDVKKLKKSDKELFSQFKSDKKSVLEQLEANSEIQINLAKEISELAQKGSELKLKLVELSAMHPDTQHTVVSSGADSLAESLETDVSRPASRFLIILFLRSPIFKEIIFFAFKLLFKGDILGAINVIKMYFQIHKLNLYNYIFIIVFSVLIMILYIIYIYIF